ncbi:hypothetical protein VF21_05993 [Pseudogymnoascus sp. 05NY08]|nr:hypothetical protein VF21_05993 [Pseudogymnoascus sp. 05NY08]
MEQPRIVKPDEPTLADDQPKTTIKDLNPRHRDIFTRAVKNVLSSEIAQITYAQIIDGLPLSSVEKDTVMPWNSRESSTALAASQRSKAFQTRLVELVAIATHQIAVQLFKLDIGLHKDDGIASWEPPKDNTMFWRRNPNGPPPTVFRHKFYRDYDQYPEGVADGVGYWAEARILGGVVLFDRREVGFNPTLGPSFDLDAIYFHPDRQNVTYRIFQLLDSQKKQLLNYLLSEDKLSESCPLPILGGDDNCGRVDIEENITDTGIYRDIWERKPPPLDQYDPRMRDVWTYFDHTSRDDWDASHGRAYDKKEQMYRHDDEEDLDRE